MGKKHIPQSKKRTTLDKSPFCLRGEANSNMFLERPLLFVGVRNCNIAASIVYRCPGSTGMDDNFQQIIKPCGVLSVIETMSCDMLISLWQLDPGHVKSQEITCSFVCVTPAVLYVRPVLHDCVRGTLTHSFSTH